MQSSATLLTLKSEERDQSQKSFRRMSGEPTQAISMEPHPTDLPCDLKALSHVLGLCEVITPATGNCLAIVVARTIAGAVLDVPATNLDRLTVCIKNGIKCIGSCIRRSTLCMMSAWLLFFSRIEKFRRRSRPDQRQRGSVFGDLAHRCPRSVGAGVGP